MLRKMFRGLAFGIGAATLIGLSLLPASAASGGAAGAVYALTNSTAGNAVVVYQRGADGSLTPDGLFATGGLGTGSSLGSQGGVIVSDDHQLLFAVNAGDNTISSFRIRPDGLELADTASSGGTMRRASLSSVGCYTSSSPASRTTSRDSSSAATLA